MPTPDGGVLHHDASETRRRVLAELRATDHRLHPREIATRLELHVNTVQRHLEVLEGAGLVVRRTEERHAPGRPRVVYEAIEACDRDCDGHRFLARALSTYVAAVMDPATAGREAGEAWGRHLIAAEPFARTEPDAAIDLVVGLLRSIGLDQSRRAGEDAIELTPCPYPDLVESLPDLMCHLHAGIIRGALAGLGAPITVNGHGPCGDCTPCVVRYTVTAAADTAG